MSIQNKEDILIQEEKDKHVLLALQVYSYLAIQLHLNIPIFKVWQW